MAESSSNDERPLTYRDSSSDILKQCHDAVDIVEQVLLRAPGSEYHDLKNAHIPANISVKQGVVLTFGAIGSYACNVWQSKEPVHVSMAGTPTESTFFSFARSKLRSVNQDIIIEESNDHGFIMFKLYLCGINIHISYHQASVEQIKDLWCSKDIPEDTLPLQKQHYQDRAITMELLEIFKDSTRNRGFYAEVYTWATRLGLLSSTFNLLSPSTLLNMVATAILRLDASPSNPTLKLSSFFSSLETLYCTNDLSHPTHSLIPKPTFNTHTVLSYLLNQHLTCSSRYLQANPTANLMSDEASYSSCFIADYPRFLKLDLSYFGLSQVKGARLVNDIERILAGFIRRLEIRLHPTLIVRAWPTRLCQQSTEPGFDSKDSAEAGSKDHEATYLVGAKVAGDDSNGIVTEDLWSSLPQLLQDEIRRSKHYSTDSAFVEVDWLEGEQARKIRWLDDTKNWGPLPEERKRGDEEDDDPEIEDEAEAVSEARKSKASKFRGKLSKGMKEDFESIRSTQEGNKVKLRPALDVMHRIKNDPALDDADYIVGYLDRHTGMKEMPVEWWILKEQTEQDFIPQSRIRFFKRVSDGTIVWDREKRLDLMFSGGGRKEQVD